MGKVIERILEHILGDDDVGGCGATNSRTTHNVCVCMCAMMWWATMYDASCIG